MLGMKSNPVPFSETSPYYLVKPSRQKTEQLSLELPQRDYEQMRQGLRQQMAYCSGNRQSIT